MGSDAPATLPMGLHTHSTESRLSHAPASAVTPTWSPTPPSSAPASSSSPSRTQLQHRLLQETFPTPLVRPPQPLELPCMRLGGHWLHLLPDQPAPVSEGPGLMLPWVASARHGGRSRASMRVCPVKDNTTCAPTLRIRPFIHSFKQFMCTECQLCTRSCDQ